jgi:hypothetical protein
MKTDFKKEYRFFRSISCNEIILNERWQPRSQTYSNGDMNGGMP